MFWAGLPISLTLWDPLNVELDINYGYVESMGRYDALRYNDLTSRMGSTEREGWLVKALVEYKMDWGTPASSAGMLPVTTATSRTVPSVCPPSPAAVTSCPSWATATTAGPLTVLCTTAT